MVQPCVRKSKTMTGTRTCHSVVFHGGMGGRGMNVG